VHQNYQNWLIFDRIIQKPEDDDKAVGNARINTKGKAPGRARVLM